MAEHENSRIETVFEEQGSLRKPGPIGRVVRFLLGAWLLWALYILLRSWTGLVDTTPPGGIDFWLFVIFASWVTPIVRTRPLDERRGRPAKPKRGNRAAVPTTCHIRPDQ